MIERPDALQILLDELANVAPSIPRQMVEAVYGIEERAQFLERRAEAQGRIAEVVKATLDREAMGGTPDGNAS